MRIKENDQQLIVLTMNQVQEVVAAAVAEAMAGNCQLEQVEKPRITIRGIRALATYLGCSVSLAQQMKNEGRVPYHRLGNRLIFDAAEVDDAISSNK